MSQLDIIVIREEYSVHKIGLLVYPNCIPSGLFSCLDYFEAANIICGKSLFQVKFVGLSADRVKCAHGQIVRTQANLEDYNPEILILPGFWTEPRHNLDVATVGYEKFQEKLGRLSRQIQIWSYCTGVLFHAKTGRLDKNKATATWWLAPKIENQFQNVQWRLDQNIVTTKRDWTASGANGHLAICEFAISKYLTARHLETIKKFLMTPRNFRKNDPFDTLFSSMPKNSFLESIQKIAERTRASDLSAKEVSHELGMSYKSLSRKTLTLTKLSPSRLLRLIKLRQAAEQLKKNGRSVKEVCANLGFEDEPSFRKAFKRACNFSPSEFQQKFST